MRPVYVILLVLMNLLWAATYTMFKVLAPHLDAGGIATLRYTAAAVSMLMFWPWLPGRTPRGADLRNTLLMGVIVFVVGMRLQISGTLIGQAGDVSLLMAVDPLVTAVAAALFLRERIALRRWVGFGLGMAGTLFISRVWSGDFRSAGLLASALILLHFVCETAYSILGKPILERAGVLKVSTLAFVSGAAVNWGLELVGGGDLFRAASHLPWPAWLMVLYLGIVCTAVGYSLWYFVIRETPVNVAAVTVFLQPLAGLAYATAFLGERLHWGQLWGSAIIILGLAVGLRRGPKPRVPEAPNPCAAPAEPAS